MVREKQKGVFETLKDKFQYKGMMASPRIDKVVISTGIGNVTDKNKIEVIQDRLSKITGQKPSPRPAKKSIAGFKTREGQIIGYQVTIRGPRMYDFLDRFLHVALPRTRDFRGIKQSAIDEMGNVTIGVKEHIIFPETAEEDLRDVFGLSVTIVTTAKNKEEALVLLKHLGVPFRESDK